MGAGLTARRAGVLSYRLSVAARPMGLHGGSLRGAAPPVRGAPKLSPRRKADGEFPTGRAAFALRPATARTTIPAESTPTPTPAQIRRAGAPAGRPF